MGGGGRPLLLFPDTSALLAMLGATWQQGSSTAFTLEALQVRGVGTLGGPFTGTARQWCRCVHGRLHSCRPAEGALQAARWGEHWEAHEGGQLERHMGRYRGRNFGRNMERRRMARHMGRHMAWNGVCVCVMLPEENNGVGEKMKRHMNLLFWITCAHVMGHLYRLIDTHE